MAESEGGTSSERFFSGEEHSNPPSEHSLPEEAGSNPSAAGSSERGSEQGDVGVPIPGVPAEVEVHHEVVMLPGMVGFDDFEDNYDVDYDDWEADDTDDASVDWEMIQQEFSGDEDIDDDDEDIEGSDVSFETEGLPEDGIPRLSEPHLLDPTSLLRYSAESSYSHHQVADALCCDGGSCELPGHREVLMYCGENIQIRRLSPDGKDFKVLFDERIKPLEAAFVQHVQPFSIARTDDGRFIAIAADIGFVYLKQIEREAPSQLADTSNSVNSQNQSSSRAGEKDGQCQKDHDVPYKKKREHVFVMSHLPEMANSVRFGLIGGKTRLMVGCQSKFVVFFELPDDNLRLPAVASLCPNQMEEACHSSDEANGRGAVDVLHLTDQYMPDARIETAAIGPFPEAVNYVEASRDGRWLAVCLDLGYAVLLDEKDRYQLARSRKLRYDDDERLGKNGNHYCSFSPSGEYLVATSDRVTGAMVWGTESGELLFRVPTQRPSLPVRFLDQTVFAFAEVEKRAHIVDIGFHERAHQIMHVPISKDNPPEARITGLSAVDGRLLISTTDQVLSYQSLPSKSWSRERHQFYPEPFKTLVKIMLMGSRADVNSDLYRLPPANLEQIIRLASTPIGMWFPAKKKKTEKEAAEENSSNKLEFSVESLRESLKEES
ncbi:hypothetical protein BSKO_11187 [Bryopsis sp. KO-2023]|nr:hypothetical protein BSKO_11187 [Bryopsis sp. KO-2023]